MRIVTGMHRSGTSFVTQLLDEIGMDTGDPQEFIPTDEWNRDGYYELQDVVTLNDRLILGDALYTDGIRASESHGKPFWSRFKMALAVGRYVLIRNGRPIERRAGRKQDEIGALGDRYRDVVVKDPRFCLTLGQWKRYAGVDSVLFSYRHPLEVSRSLARRERIPLWVGFESWRFHIRRFLEDAHQTPMVFVNFNRFFDPDEREEELRRCYAFAGRRWNQSEGRAILDRVLKRSLRNNHAGEAEMPASCRPLWRELERWRARAITPQPYSAAAETFRSS